ncbi:carbohydrate ABC transporter permease [Paenibacillus sp. KR2-11]|uniref:carbohydrate ABC transporter permease n=1 Tax=Paenibacillus sp. KR2-11 TaxID=3385500 RepID=UPI0038FCD109|nr:carbohydrate ABC transporter permease [Paenibacillus caseinilyticus]
MKRSAAEVGFDWVNKLLLSLLGCLTLYPFLYVFGLSISPPQEVHLIGLQLFPFHPTFRIYEKVLSLPHLLDSYVFTALRTVLGVAITVLVTTLTAYPLARRTFPHRSFFMKLMVFSMLFNGGVIPSYLLVKQLGLMDSVWALVLPCAISGFQVIVVRNFFEAIPGEIAESARIDGAGEYGIYVRIVLPLSAPILAVVCLWAAVHHWNAWFDAMIYISDVKKQVLSLFLRRNILDESATTASDMTMLDPLLVTPKNLEAAMIMAVSMPILLAYPFVQNYFAQGILLGSVKG